MNPRVIPKLAPDVSIKASPKRTESFQDKWQGKFLLSKKSGPRRDRLREKYP